MIKLSIIVPVWNVEDYLEKCLDSLVNQTLKDIEVIVVNDESPDDSQTIIDRYVETYPEKVKAFWKKNGGQGSARNLGLDHAQGEYISFVDSDDWISLDFCEKMYECAITKNCDVVICDMIDVYPTHEVHHNCIIYDYLFQHTLSSCNKVFKKDVVEKLRFYPQIWYEDMNFTAKILAMNVNVGVVNDVFYYCHCRETSTMINNNSKKNLDLIVAIEDIKQYLNDMNYPMPRNVIYPLVYKDVLHTGIMRVAAQKNKDKKMVLKKLQQYAKENLKGYKQSDFHQYLSRNMKIVAWLNLHGLWRISQLLVKIKQVGK